LAAAPHHECDELIGETMDVSSANPQFRIAEWGEGVTGTA
jgi:hypothetical protein